MTYPSGSGSNIHAWLARGVLGGGSVLLLHGVGANRTSIQRARFLHRLGFTVLAPDLQANGESPGEHVTFGARESLDAAASMTFLRGAMPAERVGVIGISMGGAAALLGPGPLDANAFVLESVYPTIRQAVSDRLGTWLGPLGGVARLFTPAVLHFVGDEVGVREIELRPIDQIARLRAPSLNLPARPIHTRRSPRRSRSMRALPLPRPIGRSRVRVTRTCTPTTRSNTSDASEGSCSERCARAGRNRSGDG